MIREWRMMGFFFGIQNVQIFALQMQRQAVTASFEGRRKNDEHDSKCQCVLCQEGARIVAFWTPFFEAIEGSFNNAMIIRCRGSGWQGQAPGRFRAPGRPLVEPIMTLFNRSIKFFSLAGKGICIELISAKKTKTKQHQ